MLIRPEGVTLNQDGTGFKSRVADILFQKNGFRVTLENGLYFYTAQALKVGDELSFSVEAECLG